MLKVLYPLLPICEDSQLPLRRLTNVAEFLEPGPKLLQSHHPGGLLVLKSTTPSVALGDLVSPHLGFVFRVPGAISSFSLYQVLHATPYLLGVS